MTKVVHLLKQDKIEKKCKNPCFVLTNNIGGFSSFSNEPISKCEGIFFNKEFEVFKTINNLELVEEKTPKKITNKFYKFEREYNDVLESFTMPKGKNAFIYWLNKKRKVKLSLDCRKIFDLRKWGRYYKIYKEKNKIIIEYTKKKDAKEDNNGEEYKIYVAISSDSNKYKKLDTWREEKYSFDEEREFKKNPSRYVYDAILIDCKTLVFGFSTNKKEAIKEVEDILLNFSASKNQKLDTTNKIKTEKEVRMAYYCCKNSLKQLYQKIDGLEGIYAGIWWFYQYWTRDTAVSTKALMLNNDYEKVKKILKNYVLNLEKDGRISNRLPKSELKSADGVGWVFKRVGDLIEILEKKRKLSLFFIDEEIILLKNKLKECTKSLIKNHTKDDFAINSSKETWMDTTGETEDNRKGIRLEIQALRLNIYNLLKRLSYITGDDLTYSEAKELEETLLKKVRTSFWNGKYLNDGKDDKTIRPNVFLAYYIYPELLSEEEWIKCFDYVIPRLWCKWGGLTSIDKKHKLYCSKHTGEDNKSYHRGDSWYWINNLAAICMHRLDKEKYLDYILKIINASVNEILWQGCIGCHAEISSARKQESWGCLDQAWSNAIFIELVEELFN